MAFATRRTGASVVVVKYLRLPEALCKRAFREFGGALIECSPLGFDTHHNGRKWTMG